MDVTYLYTNITTDLSLNALEYWINKYSEIINSRFSKELILEASRLVLKKEKKKKTTHSLSTANIFCNIKERIWELTWCQLMPPSHFEEKMYNKTKQQ